MEIWKDIEGYEGLYEISSYGRVKSLERYVSTGLQLNLRKQRIRKLSFNKDGYKYIHLSKNKTKKFFLAHRLVSLSFLDNPENKPCVNHINGIKDDNRVENLEWCTLSENQIHAYKNGLQKGYSVKGEQCKYSKLNNEKVLEIRRIGNSMKQKEIALLFGVNYRTISSVLKRLSWNHI